METEINNLFNTIQKSDKYNQEHIIEKIKDSILENNLPVDSFLNILNVLFLNAKKSDLGFFFPIIKNIFDELTTKAGQEFLKRVFAHLFICLESKNKNIRKNAILLLIYTSENFEIKNNLILEMCARLYDKEREVTKAAIKFLASYQDTKFNKKDCVYTIFIDLLRHNPFADIRKEALKYVALNEKTMNIVVEKGFDRDFSVRNVFYDEIFEKLDLKMLKKEKLEFLIDKIFSDREFNLKDKLIEKIIIEFNLINNFYSFLTDILIEKYEDFLCCIFEKIEVEINCYPKNINEAKIFKSYLNFVETKKGRDALILPDLNEFLRYLNTKCNEQHEKGFIINLFSIINFYDIFDSASNEMLINLIDELLSKNEEEEIIESCILAYKNIYIENNLLEDFILKVNNKNKTKIGTVCKFIMKHLSEKITLCNLIISNILPKLKQNEDYYIILLHYVANFDNSDKIDEILNSKCLNIITDLFLLKNNSKAKEKIFEMLDILIFDDDEAAILPIIKLLVSKNLYDKNYLTFILKKNYDDIEDFLKQFCIVFLHEYFLNDIHPLIDAFVEFYQSTKDKKMFLNHTLFWLQKSKTENGSQKLFYKICCEMLKTDMLKNEMNLLVAVLDKIEILNDWEITLTKKILYCCTLILKKMDNKNIINGIVGKILLINDDEPISKEQIEEIKNDLVFK